MLELNMLKFRLCILLVASVLHLCATAQILPQLGYFVVVRQLECMANAKYITDASCNIMQPRNRSAYAALTLSEKITSLTGYLEVSVPKQKKQFQKIFDVTFELCKVLRERKRMTLIGILSTMARLGNTTALCPIYPGFYHAENITIVESLPPVLTETDFLVHFNWFLPRVAHVLNITVLGHLYEISRNRKFL